MTDDKRDEFYNVVFYKERTIAENNLEQRLIMTFSLKYQVETKKGNTLQALSIKGLEIVH